MDIVHIQHPLLGPGQQSTGRHRAQGQTLSPSRVGAKTMRGTRHGKVSDPRRVTRRGEAQSGDQGEDEVVAEAAMSVEQCRQLVVGLDSEPHGSNLVDLRTPPGMRAADRGHRSGGSSGDHRRGDGGCGRGDGGSGRFRCCRSRAGD